MPRTALLLIVLSAWCLPLQAKTIPLYDDSRSNLPQDQRWLAFIKFPLRTSMPMQAVSGAGVEVDTGAAGNAGAGGFTSHLLVPPFPTLVKNPAFPVLDPSLGFTLSFELTLHDEDHVSSSRAGFSVLLLGADRRGIELGFWEDEIWAQSSSFSHAEGAALDTVSDEVLYQLTVVGMDYWLVADGLQLLSGSTRDYTANSPIPDPYEVGSYVFLGDNTDSASSHFTLGRVTLTTRSGGVAASGDGGGVAAPAPSALLLMLGGLAVIGARHRAA